MLLPVALIAPSGQNLQRLRQSMSSMPWKYTLREFCSIEALNEGLEKFPFRILVMRVPHFHVGFVEALRKARVRFPHVGLITVTNQVDPLARARVRDLERHALIDERWETRDFHAVVERLERGEKLFGRMHPRTLRASRAIWVDHKSGLILTGVFEDFAQMGARIRISSESTGLTYGELRYESSSQPGQWHRIECKVIREQRPSPRLERILNPHQLTVCVRFLAKI